MHLTPGSTGLLRVPHGQEPRAGEERPAGGGLSAQHADVVGHDTGHSRAGDVPEGGEPADRAWLAFRVPDRMRPLGDRPWWGPWAPPRTRPAMGENVVSKVHWDQAELLRPTGPGHVARGGGGPHAARSPPQGATEVRLSKPNVGL